MEGLAMGPDMRNPEKCIDMELNCPGRSEMLSILRNFVSSVAEDMGFSDEEIAKIEISVDEACANVVKHAYDEPDCGSSAGKETGCKMTIKVKAAPDHLNIIIIDYGAGNKSGPHKGVNDVGEFIERGHGLGTYIMNKFMDKVEVHYPEGRGTTISMIKFLSQGK